MTQRRRKNSLPDLVALDLAGLDLLVALAAAVAQAVAVPAHVELKCLGVRVPAGLGVEVGAVDIECRGELNVFAAAVGGAVHGDLAAVGCGELEVPPGDEGGDGEEEKAGLHIGWWF